MATKTSANDTSKDDAPGRKDLRKVTEESTGLAPQPASTSADADDRPKSRARAESTDQVFEPPAASKRSASTLAIASI